MWSTLNQRSWSLESAQDIWRAFESRKESFGNFLVKAEESLSSAKDLTVMQAEVTAQKVNLLHVHIYIHHTHTPHTHTTHPRTQTHTPHTHHTHTTHTSRTPYITYTIHHTHITHTPHTTHTPNTHTTHTATGSDGPALPTTPSSSEAQSSIDTSTTASSSFNTPLVAEKLLWSAANIKVQEKPAQQMAAGACLLQASARGGRV